MLVQLHWMKFVEDKFTLAGFFKMKLNVCGDIHQQLLRILKILKNLQVEI